MTLRDFVVQAMTVLAPLVLTTIGIFAARLTEAIRKRVQNDRLRQLLETLASLIATGVANAYQVTVRDLKDPEKPGDWTKSMGASLKSQVISDVKASAPHVMDQLKELGVEQIDALMGRMVEQSVTETPKELVAAPLVVPIPTSPDKPVVVMPAVVVAPKPESVVAEEKETH